MERESHEDDNEKVSALCSTSSSTNVNGDRVPIGGIDISELPLQESYEAGRMEREEEGKHVGEILRIKKRWSSSQNQNESFGIKAPSTQKEKERLQQGIQMDESLGTGGFFVDSSVSVAVNKKE